MNSFTIIIPSYNSQNHITLCLDSILKINYDKTLINVLVIDDGSNDNTQKIVKKYVDNYPFIKYHYKDNHHWGSVINYVKNNKLINTDYVSILDSDDQLLPETFNILNKINKGQNHDLLVGSFRLWNGKRKTIKKYPYLFLFQRTLTNKQKMNTPMCLPLIFFSKKEIFYQMEDLREGVAYQDSNYLSQLVKYSKSLVFTRKSVGLYYYNRAGNSMSEPWNETRVDIEYTVCLQLIKNNAQENVVFRLFQNSFRKGLKNQNKELFVVDRKFNFSWFPFYLKWIFIILHHFTTKKFFVRKK